MEVQICPRMLLSELLHRIRHKARSDFVECDFTFLGQRMEMEKHLGEEGVQLAKTDKEQHQGVSFLAFLLSSSKIWFIVKDFTDMPWQTS